MPPCAETRAASARSAAITGTNRDFIIFFPPSKASPGCTAWNWISASPTAEDLSGYSRTAKSNTSLRPECMRLSKLACSRCHRMSKRSRTENGFAWSRIWVSPQAARAPSPPTLPANCPGARDAFASQPTYKFIGTAFSSTARAKTTKAASRLFPCPTPICASMDFR